MSLRKSVFDGFMTFVAVAKLIFKIFLATFRKLQKRSLFCEVLLRRALDFLFAETFYSEFFIQRSN